MDRKQEGAAVTLEIWARLLPALIYVESRGNPAAVSDGGRSVGVLQIQAAVVADVNRLYGTTFRWPDDCRSEWASTVIAVRYLCHYAGPDANAETWARTWNGGPKGATKRATVAYWERVKKAMEGGR